MTRPLHDARRTSRRQFLATAGAALAGATARGAAPLHAQEGALLLPPYVTDVDGDGQIGDGDQQIVEHALYAQRGFDLLPAAGFDQRADVFGRGAVDAHSVDSVTRSVAQYGASTVPLPPRPITVAWHYGWYKTPARPPGLQTVRFKGGNYVSSDPEIEATFHDLKNEFGIAVDALSWIPERDPDNPNNQDNYRRGFLRAPNAASRHVCLLYENTIALPTSGSRIDVRSPEVRSLLREDFAAMARDLVEIRDSTPARVFTLDERPVIFIFGSHAWGLLPRYTSTLFPHVDSIVAEVREIFRETYGAFPYLVGDELFVSPTGDFSHDRQLRAVNFDAIYLYHHAVFKQLRETTLPANAAYIRNQIHILRLCCAAVGQLKNRYTGWPILVIPNLAPGFAKPGHPTLTFNRAVYADFMKALKQVHTREHISPTWRGSLRTARLPAPVYAVGSWNEEFEGHAVFPFEFNLSVSDVAQHGFDMAMAIKQVFGWNHYATRDIS